MKSIWEVPYIIIDIETTGSHPVNNRITDIACVVAYGNEILNTFTSLINPHQYIPSFIASMTGITNEMVYTAPECRDVFKEVTKILSIKDAVFVAHNSNFDWQFIKETYIRLGLDVPAIPKLCTLKLARRLLPPKMKKGVDGLTNYFKIHVSNRHRALGDAKATSEILFELLEKAESEMDIHFIDELLKLQNKKVFNYANSTKNIKNIQAQLKGIPDEPGIYYFKDKVDNILYIGKAKSLRQRVHSYFSNSQQPSRKIKELISKIKKIDYVVTGTELSALMLESKEIKKHLPHYNSVDKKYKNFTFLKFTSYEKYPRLMIADELDGDGAEYFGPFKNSFVLIEVLDFIKKKFRLRKCDDVLSPDDNNKPCFYHYIERCAAPCTNLQSSEEYKFEVETVRKFLKDYTNPILSHYEFQMNEFSDGLEFEKASLIKNKLNILKTYFSLNKNLPFSMNENNIIVLIPLSAREKTIELFMVKSGRIVHKEIIGRKAPLNKINNLLSEIYFNGYTAPLFYTPEELDELRILRSYINRNQDYISTININGFSEKQIQEELQFKIRNISFF